MTRLQQKLADNLSQKQQVMLDPATIILVATIVSEVIKMIKKCREKPEDSITLVNLPNEKEKRVLKRKIRKTLGWRKSFKEGDKYYNAVLDTGREATLQDLHEEFALAGND